MKNKELRQLARDAVNNAANAVKSADEALKKADESLKILEEIDDDELDTVTGAGNPFADVPRVPTQNIDDDLRNNA